MWGGGGRRGCVGWVGRRVGKAGAKRAEGTWECGRRVMGGGAEFAVEEGKA